jgi:creatinine amidohydrolase
LRAYVTPTLPFTTSEEHASFTGTITLRPGTMMLVLEEIVTGLRAQGFRKQVLVCGHGGAYWVGPFIKQINAQYEDIIVVPTHQGADAIWQEEVERAGLGGRGEIHGGALSRALALFLAPESVTDGAYGLRVPEGMEAYMDYVTWDKITPDGSWGRFTSEEADVATAEAGRQLLTSFVRRQGAHLQKHLEEACRIKGIAP